MRIKICRKEAKESDYWLRLIYETNNLKKADEAKRLIQEATELKKIFSSILEKSKQFRSLEFGILQMSRPFMHNLNDFS